MAGFQPVVAILSEASHSGYPPTRRYYISHLCPWLSSRVGSSWKDLHTIDVYMTLLTYVEVNRGLEIH